MTTTGLACAACGIELPPNSKFCNECGASVAAASKPAEYKQVTVLFADVVHSMDIAAAVGSERLREIMTDLVDRATVVVQRYGGTVDKFTGDGIMAVFGAPVALEDHAVRACLAALGVQEETKRLAVDVHARDRVDLRLRVGLNSGQVIAGEIGSGPFGYTAVGEQVGMAQRMESAAPPGGAMLSDSTARLVENAVVLGTAVRMHDGFSAPTDAPRGTESLSVAQETVQRRVGASNSSPKLSMVARISISPTPGSLARYKIRPCSSRRIRGLPCLSFQPLTRPLPDAIHSARLSPRPGCDPRKGPRLCGPSRVELPGIEPAGLARLAVARHRLRVAMAGRNKLGKPPLTAT
jgi:class 3 adenylate cyclase